MFKRTVNGIAAGTASLLVGILGLAAGLPLAGDTALAQTPTNMVTIALPADPVPAVVTNFRCHILPVQGQTPSRPGCDDLHLRAAGPNGFTSPDLNNHGGPVVTNTTHTFYFLNCLSNCATDWGDPITFLTDLFAGVNSTFLHVTDQYTGQSTDGRYTTSGPGVALTASVTHTITDSQLHTIIVNGIKAQFPSGGGGGIGRMYSIFLPQGQDLCFDNSNQCYCPDANCGAGNVFAFCAYHGSFDTTDAVGGALHVIYQAQPFDNVSGCQVNGGPNGALKDSVNNVFSHEIFETITDPDLNAWWRTATGDEIGDICNFNLANPISLNGHSYAIQKEYSNKAHTCVSSATTPSRVTHDFNTDGQSDISWRNTNSDLAIWLMNGTAASSAVDLGGVPNSWSIVGQRDFNGDSKADILWRNTNGDLAMWFMNGTAVSSTADLGFVPTSWSVAGTGDFNGDGKADILWRNTNGDVAIWLMNGAAVISAVDLGGVPTSWSIVGTGDFDGDGKTDILWRNTNGDLAIWLMNGTAISSGVDLGLVPTSWSVAGTGDFNANGKDDILWRNTNGDTAIWLMNGAAVSSAFDIGLVPVSWSIAGTGDFNGDGKADILWRNTNGDTSIWLMNGAAVSSAVDIGIVPTSWTVQGVN